MNRRIYKTIIFFLFFFGIVLLLPNLVSAANYFVKSDGNDGLDGRSDATAWKTIGKVNKYFFKTGDDVYFKCGDTFDVSSTGLTVDWTGTVGDRVVIGAYYGDGQFGLNGNARPIFDGDANPANNWGTCDATYGDDESDCALYGTNCCYGTAIKVGDGSYDYITYQDVRVQNVGGYGISISRSDYGIIDNVEVATIYRQGTLFYNSTGCILQDSDITDTTGVGNGAAVYMKLSTNTIIRRNVVHEVGAPGRSGQEGINLWYSDGALVENNIVYDTRGMGIYIDHAIDSIVRNNLIYYTNNTDYWRYGDSPGIGIVINDELTTGDPNHLSSGNYIYGNFITNVSKGISLWSGPKNTNDPGLIDTVIANNTIVKPYRADNTEKCFDIGYSARSSNSIIKNNICWQDSNSVVSAANNTGVTWNNNLWSIEPTDADAKGANDPAYANPKLMWPSELITIEPGSLKYNYFYLNADSSAINSGSDLSTKFTDILRCGKVDWYNAELLTVDQNSQGVGWEIGACVYMESEGVFTKPEDPNDEKLAAPRAFRTVLIPIFTSENPDS